MIERDWQILAHFLCSLKEVSRVKLMEVEMSIMNKSWAVSSVSCIWTNWGDAIIAKSHGEIIIQNNFCFKSGKTIFVIIM
jgi:hypothetical protein